MSYILEIIRISVFRILYLEIIHIYVSVLYQYLCLYRINVSICVLISMSTFWITVR